jgi:hypothetical protein
MVTLNALADAIYLAEGGANTRHPYGIMAHYEHTTPRQACINTILSTERLHHVEKIDKYFIYLLADKYCPPSCDPQGNKNWKVNVVRILHL